jgi:AcrR family transcriptional regulator
LEKGPQGLRRGRGARERILSASAQLFRDQGINSTGMDQLCAVAGVSKRTLYQHFPSKDELIAEHLRRFDPNVLPEVFNRADLTPRERLLTPFDIQSPLCPFIAAAVEISDPGHPARVYARDYKQALAARFIEAARAAGATDPDALGEQLALLLDGAAARSRVLDASAFTTAAAAAAVLVDTAIPTAAVPPDGVEHPDGARRSERGDGAVGKVGGREGLGGDGAELTDLQRGLMRGGELPATTDRSQIGHPVERIEPVATGELGVHERLNQ